MRIFVTGGTGFLGGHTINAAHRRGHQIVALRRPGSRPRVVLDVAPCWIDGTLESDLIEPLRGCEALLHLAAYGVSPQPCDWIEALRQNVYLPAAFIQQAVEVAEVRNIVVAGSCTEYGLASSRYEKIPTTAPLEPVEPYATSKAAFSLFLHAFSAAKMLSATLLRPFHIYGEAQYAGNFWPQLHHAALIGDDFPMSPGQQVRDFLPVEVAAELFVDAIENPTLPGRFLIENLGSGQAVTLAAFATCQWERLGAKGKLCLGALPYRANEMMRFVPELSPSMQDKVRKFTMDRSSLVQKALENQSQYGSCKRSV